MQTTINDNRLDIGSELKDCILFLRNNIKKSGSELQKLVEEFPHKKELFQLVDHMIATSLGGWTRKGPKLVNETGHEASEENWTLLEDGKLASKGGVQATYNLDKLIMWRNYCD